MLIYGISVTDKRVPMTVGQKLVGLVLAVLNCFYLFVASLGIVPAMSADR